MTTRWPIRHPARKYTWQNAKSCGDLSKAHMKNFKFLIILYFCISCLFQKTRASDDLNFPKDFWWGTSLAAHQSEGGNNNTWTRWESSPGNIKNNDKSGLADDHWNLFETDFDNLVKLNANTHRMSI